MEETQAIRAHLGLSDYQDGCFTSRTVTGYFSPPQSPKERFSLPGHRSAGRFHYQRTETEAVDFAAHHSFASPRIVRASHELRLEEVRRSTGEPKVGKKDCVTWRNRRVVARNLFLDRVGGGLV